MEPVKSVQQGGIKKKSPDRTKRYPADFKLQIVKKYLEESIPVSVIRQECGVSGETISRWVRSYRLKGEAGLTPSYTGQGQAFLLRLKRRLSSSKKPTRYLA